MKLIVQASEYNGSKDVLFLMNSNDFRLTNPAFASGYTIITEGTHKSKDKLFLGKNGITYKVYQDWSVKAA